ncbi:CheR family methyltransferase [Limnoglobus roseus]|uniref:protein-glutamate O-methyltransferase n=1 Tax=Limnoglobus roseus TaxID=2598579 RepID=A0A5C1ANM7_9BACT|nr:protein-glutamate O-methyltransferase CheR [Limnoglobus roseus]QEL20600.1 protein-glutamate O-methyltransferase CheR [Limnoglobus roseus]
MTPNDSAANPLTLGVFLLLRDLIRERLGVWFEEEKRDLLASKLSDRIAALGLRSFLDYYYLLKYGPGSEVEWPRLTDALSVQETYFWREYDQIKALIDILLPQHVADNRGPIRIWSAACATGEEPLTLVMALEESGWFGRADVQVWASDFSPAALAHAEQGLYRERSFRAIPTHLRARYFTSEGNRWRVAPRIQSRVRYAKANLLDQVEIGRLATAPFIFCRNVFIYFSLTTISQVVASFAARMPRPAHLFVGTSESLLRVKTAFELQEVGQAFVYVVK